MPLPPPPENPQRPPASGPLGGKAADCFIFSAAHDPDEEFLRRYAGQPERIRFMLDWHAADPTTEAARKRLARLTKTKP
jgi:hypothetical protein